MSAALRDLAPGLATQLEKISHLPLVQYVNETVWIFAIIETTHLLFLAMLGGAVLALNLKLLGAALGTASTEEVERATRPWLVAGIVGTLVTGVAMGLTTVNTLLASAAFLVKMVALVAGILFSVAVARLARRNEAAAPDRNRGKVLAIIASAFWFASLLLFVTGQGLASGAFLVALAGFALFAAFTTRWRRAYVVGVVAILGGGIFAVEWISGDGVEGPTWLPLLPLGGALALAVLIGVLERRVPERVSPSPARFAAFASTLAWITVAAAGRWIGFS
jgi:MFS family permease